MENTRIQGMSPIGWTKYGEHKLGSNLIKGNNKEFSEKDDVFESK